MSVWNEGGGEGASEHQQLGQMYIGPRFIKSHLKDWRNGGWIGYPAFIHYPAIPSAC